MTIKKPLHIVRFEKNPWKKQGNMLFSWKFYLELELASCFEFQRRSIFQKVQKAFLITVFNRFLYLTFSNLKINVQLGLLR